MERIIRLNQIWSWLPAFRAVAETEHLHEAAALVHLTPSTLSRAIHLLEDALGCALFRRLGRSLELTDEGHELLRALREAMRRVDDAVVSVTCAPTSPLRVAADDAVALTALADLLGDVALPPELSAAGSDVAARLLRGSIDVAFVSVACAPRDIVVEHVGLLAYSVHCAPTHPLARSACTAAALKAHPFVDAPDLPWPPERTRSVGLRVGGAALALAACRTGGALAMLPDALAADLPCVRGSDGEPIVSLWQPIYALRRPPIGAAAAVDALIASVRSRLEQPVREMAMDRVAAGA
jgi:DNA-binding transcriptional LysR family regulator